MEAITEKSVLLIDGANMHSCARNLGLEIDYRKLAEYVGSRTYLHRSYYYTAMLDQGEFNSIRPLVDWLDYNGFKVVTKDAKEYTSAEGVRRIKGNMDIELAVDAMSLAGSVDHFYICSGDGDFVYLVNELQRRGRRVTIVSSRKTSPAMLSDSLRRCADDFIDIDDIRTIVGRPRPVTASG